MRETRTSPASAKDDTRSAIWTAMPETSEWVVSISPVCRPGADAETQLARAVANGTRTRDRPGRPVEHDQEAVAHDLDFRAAESFQLATHGCVMSREQLAPAQIPQLGRAARGAGDIGEQHRREHPFGTRLRAGAGRELLDLVQGGVGISGPVQVVGAVELDELRVRNVLGEIPPERGRHVGVVAVEEHDGRCRDRGQDRADIQTSDQSLHRNRGTRADRAPRSRRASRCRKPSLAASLAATAVTQPGSPVPHQFANCAIRPSRMLGSQPA